MNWDSIGLHSDRMFIPKIENSDKLHCSLGFFFFLSKLFSFWRDYWTNDNIAGKFKYCKHRTSTEAHLARRGQKTPTQAALTAFFYSSSIDFSISFSLRTNSWASLSPMRASNILMIGFSGGESKQMRAPPTPDTNISRLNGFSCCIGEVIGNPELHPLDFQEANIMFV